VTLSEARRLRVGAADVVARLEPESVPLTEASALWSEFDRVERLAASAKTLLARRVDESMQWKRQGFRSAAEHLAALGDTTVGAARDTLGVSQRIASLPETAAAVRDGRLSTAQTTVLVGAAAADPASESRLLAEAERSSLAELQQECLRTKANADPDRDTTYRRIHAQRRLRTWTDAEGAWNLAARGTADAGARVLAALEPLIDERFSRTRTEGAREAREAYAFDALVTLTDQATRGSEQATGRRAPEHLALLRVDLGALTRGQTKGDEVCELSGLGPIPVSRARELLGESTLRLVITKGVDVVHVTHLGRGPSAAQRIALLWSSPTCSVEGCTRTRVEIDHRDDWAKGGRTELPNLDPLCTHHHDLKTNDGWALLPGSGKRPIVPPDDSRHPRRARRGANRAPPEHTAA
jgi:hypothetical protein